MSNEQDLLMHGTTPDGKTVYWLPMEPWIMGDPLLCLEVETQLFLANRAGGIMVTPTGPLVEAVPSEQLAVFAAANEAAHWKIEWTNPPDVLFGIPAGDMDGPSVGETEGPPADAAQLRAVNELRMVLGLDPLTADGWNPTKQWRDPGGEGGGRFIDMPDIKARLAKEARAKAKAGDHSGTPNPMPNPQHGAPATAAPTGKGEKSKKTDVDEIMDLLGPGVAEAKPGPEVERPPAPEVKPPASWLQPGDDLRKAFPDQPDIHWVPIEALEGLEGNEGQQAGKVLRDDTDAMAKEMREKGLRSDSHLTVEYNPEDGSVKLGEGNHRLDAAKRAGITHLPVKVFRSKNLESSTKSDAKEVGSQRKEDGGRWDPESYTEDQVAEILGFNKPESEAPAIDIDNPKPVDRTPAATPVATLSDAIDGWAKANGFTVEPSNMSGDEIVGSLIKNSKGHEVAEVLIDTSDPKLAIETISPRRGYEDSLGGLEEAMEAAYREAGISSVLGNNGLFTVARKPQGKESDASPRGAGFEQLGYQPHNLSNPEIMQDALDHLDNSYHAYMTMAIGLGGTPDDENEERRLLTKDEYAQEVANHIIGSLRGNAAVRAPSERLGAIITGGLKSQFETGDSRGFFNPEGRSVLEKNALNVPSDIPDHQRPVYGVVDDGEAGSTQYGNVIVDLKPDKVYDRSTVTFGDSLDAQSTAGIKRSELEADGADPLLAFATLGPSEAAGLAELVASDRHDNYGYGGDADPVSDYHEVQIHGGVPPEDIFSMYIDEYDSEGESVFAEYYGEEDAQSYIEGVLAQLGISEAELAKMGPDAMSLLHNFMATASIEEGEQLVHTEQFKEFLDELIRMAGGDFKVIFGDG